MCVGALTNPSCNAYTDAGSYTGANAGSRSRTYDAVTAWVRHFEEDAAQAAPSLFFGFQRSVRKCFSTRLVRPMRARR